MNEQLKGWLKANLLPEETTEAQLHQFFPNLTIAEIISMTGDEACDLNNFRELNKEQAPEPEPQPQPEPVAPVVAKPAPVKAPVSQTPTINPLDPLLAYFQEHLQPQQQPINPEEIGQIVDEKVKAALANHTRRIEVVLPDLSINEVTNAHYIFPSVLKLLPLGNLYIYGPAGTGKSFIAMQAAEALNLPFYCEGVGPQSSQSAFKGYMDATGKYVTTQFRTAWETGGVFCLDEVDAGHPSILLSLNMARAKREFSFADGNIKCHKDFYLICTANTFGTGATREYVGRNQLDSAFLDGFFNIELDYDTKLEIDLYGEAAEIIHGWRNKLKGERVILSIRSIERLHRLLQVGETMKEAKAIVAGNIPENLRSRII